LGDVILLGLCAYFSGLICIIFFGLDFNGGWLSIVRPQVTTLEESRRIFGSLRKLRISNVVNLLHFSVGGLSVSFIVGVY
jgi:hypothetical protein